MATRFHVDLTPLRESRNFRCLFFGGGISSLGSMVTYVALPFQVKELTDSYVAVGLIGLLQLGPMIIFGLWGGALADAHDRRRIVIVSEAAALIFAIGLLINALLPSPHLWAVYLLAMLFSTADSIQRPASMSIVPLVVPHDHLPAAAALQTIPMSTATIVGPAIGGFILTGHGTAWAFAVDAATYVVSLLFYLGMTRLPAVKTAERPSVRRIVEGVKYAWQRKDLLGTYLVDVVAMLLAFPYALFPFVADELGAPWALGWLYSAGAVGGLLATLTSGWIRHIHHHGRGVVVAATIWGLAIGCFGLSTELWVALVFLGFAGAADMISGIFRITIWNQTVPDEFRGRLAGIEMMSYLTGPQLGQVRSGLVAQATSLRFSIAGGGFASAIFAATLGLLLPALWRYDVRTDPYAAAQRNRRPQTTDRSNDPDVDAP